MTTGSSHTRSFVTWLWDWTKSIVVALVVWFFLRTFLIEAFRIPSGSMENTLLIGDFLFVNKALYGAEVPIIKARLPAVREPVRNDILVFDSVEEEGLKVVKRLVGMPGDTLAMENGALFRNGKRVDEPYAVHTDPDRSEDPIQRAKMRALAAQPSGPAGHVELPARSPGLGPDRRPGRFVLHDGGQSGQLVRRPVLGIPAADQRAGAAAGGVLQLRREQLAVVAVLHRGALGKAVQRASVRARRLGQGRAIEHTGDVGGCAAAGGTVEGNPAALRIVLGGSLGGAFDRFGTA